MQVMGSFTSVSATGISSTTIRRGWRPASIIRRRQVRHLLYHFSLEPPHLRPQLEDVVVYVHVDVVLAVTVVQVDAAQRSTFLVSSADLCQLLSFFLLCRTLYVDNGLPLYRFRRPLRLQRVQLLYTIKGAPTRKLLRLLLCAQAMTLGPYNFSWCYASAFQNKCWVFMRSKHSQ